jgi:uncharacterized membrane protein (UPF0127 family)
MAKLKQVTYFINGKKHEIKAKVLDNFFSQGLGLMFRTNSSPLFFVFNKERNLSITSLFCIPFRAIWLNKKMQAIKILDVKRWKFHIPGKGKYLLEIPFKTTKK